MLSPSLVGIQMGVWHIVEEQDPGRSWNYQKPTLSGFKPLFGDSYPLQFLANVYCLSSALFMLYIITYILLGLNNTLKLQFINRLFKHISTVSVFVVGVLMFNSYILDQANVQDWKF